MRRKFAALALAVLAAAAPLAAAEPSVAGDSVKEVLPQLEAETNTFLPADVEKQLTPAPTQKYGRIWGPCTIQLQCPDGVIGCSGQNHCDWRYHSPTIPGLVQCDQQPFIYCLS